MPETVLVLGRGDLLELCRRPCPAAIAASADAIFCRTDRGRRWMGLPIALRLDPPTSLRSTVGTRYFTGWRSRHANRARFSIGRFPVVPSIGFTASPGAARGIGPGLIAAARFRWCNAERRVADGSTLADVWVGGSITGDQVQRRWHYLNRLMRPARSDRDIRPAKRDRATTGWHCVVDRISTGTTRIKTGSRRSRRVEVRRASSAISPAVPCRCGRGE